MLLLVLLLLVHPIPGLGEGESTAGDIHSQYWNRERIKLFSNNRALDLDEIDVLQQLLRFSNVNPALPDLSRRCAREAEIFEVGLAEKRVWALQLLDANDLFPQSGILNGNVYHFPGSKDECLSVQGEVTGRYWMLTTRSVEPASAILSLGLTRIGRCLPSGCDEPDVILATNAYLNNITNTIGKYSAEVLNSHESNKQIELTTGDICMIVILSVVAVIIAVGTVVDLMVSVLEIQYFHTNSLHIWQGFSLYNNVIKLFNTDLDPGSGTLACLNGIRAIAVTWVVLGHTFFEMCTLGVLTGNGNMVKNLNDFKKDNGPIDGVAFTVVWNGMFDVDTFFLMGAALIAYHTLRELDKNKNKPASQSAMFWAMFYVHRYIRLSSVYAITIMLHATLLKYLATGPLSYLVSKQVDKCQNGWFLNLMYINNFANEIGEAWGKEEGGMNCMPWTWYMANDMQFFIITPIILYVLWKHLPTGLIVSSILLIMATCSPFIFTVTDEKQFFHGDLGNFYVKPWNRFQPYIIGLVFGCFLHKIRDRKDIKMSTFANLGMWLLAALVACSVIYGVSNYNLVKDPRIQDPTIKGPKNPEPSLLEKSFYNGFSKIAWSLSLCWVIYACVKGRGGLVNAFLSWGFWVPLARLSYCIYLVQYTVIYWYNSQLDYSVVYSNHLLVYTAVGNLAMSTAVALLLTLLFEMPLLHLEKLLFGIIGVGKMPAARRNKMEKKI